MKCHIFALSLAGGVVLATDPTAHAASPAGTIGNGLSAGLSRVGKAAASDAGASAASRTASGAATGTTAAASSSQRLDIPWGHHTIVPPYQPPPRHATWDFNNRSLPPPASSPTLGKPLSKGLDIPGGAAPGGATSRVPSAAPSAPPPPVPKNPPRAGQLSDKFAWAHEGPVPNGGYAGGVSRHQWHPPGTVLQRSGSPDGRIATRDIGASRAELGLPATSKQTETSLIELKSGQWSNDGKAAGTYLSDGGKSQSTFGRSMKELVQSGEARYLPGKGSQ